MYGTSVYISDNVNSPTTSQSARAANLIYVMINYRENMKNFEPIRLRNIVPICQWQYERLFNTTRKPGAEIDELYHVEKSDHVVVIHKGSFYKLNFVHADSYLNAAEIKKQIDEILNAKSDETSCEKFISSLTGLNRSKWAKIRSEHFSTGINKESLDEIENATFVVSLDDEPFIFDLDSSPSEYGNYGKQLLVGNGINRWFDKSFNLCVGKNGKAGLHADHTWGEANVSSNFFQECVIDDYHR
jgi:carnitine O-palmitoyltransferase 1